MARGGLGDGVGLAGGRYVESSPPVSRSKWLRRLKGEVWVPNRLGFGS